MIMSLPVLRAFAVVNPAANKAYNSCRQMEQTHDIQISWEEDAIGFMVFASPRPISAEDKVIQLIEHLFFKTPFAPAV